MLDEYSKFRFSTISKFQNILLTIALSILLLWPAFINGGPFWFPDTSTYIRGADAALYTVTGQASEWSNMIDMVRLPNAASELDTEFSFPPPSAEVNKIVLSGRSIFYGAIIFLPMHVFGPWAAAFVQSLISALVILFSMRIVLRQNVLREQPIWMQISRSLMPYAALCIIVVLTPLAYYANMLMPDIYAGLLCLILSVSIIFWRQMSRPEKVTGAFLACVFVTFHTTILLLAIVVSGVSFILQKNKNARVRSALFGLGVTVSAVLAGGLFTAAVEKFVGQTPMAPPFLTARITAAGPGTDFLNRHCNSDISPFAICRHRKKLPMDSDSFLWGDEKREHLFKVLPAAEQRQIASEDKRFYLTVLADSPMIVISSAMSNGIELLGRFGLENFNYSNRMSMNSQKYPEDIWKNIIKTRASTNTMPVQLVEYGSFAIIIMSFIVFFGILVQFYRKKIYISPEIIRFALVICLAVLANAMICGALSKPHSRYQARLIWLLPLAASLTLANLRRSKTPQKYWRNADLNNPALGRKNLL